MNIVKTTVAGMVGFAVGAGAMLMPGNQKFRRQVLRQLEQMKKISRMW